MSRGEGEWGRGRERRKGRACYNTSFQANKERLKHVFATYGTPRRVETDNGSLFNSRNFEDFARGFPTPQGNTPTPLSERRSREVHANDKQDRANSTLTR